MTYENGHSAGFNVLDVKANIITVDTYSLKVKFGMVFLAVLYFYHEKDESYGSHRRKIQRERKFHVQF